MLTLRNKKQLFNKLRLMMQTADEIYIPLDAESHKSKVIDRISLITSGIAAQLGMLLEQLEQEILKDEEQWRMEQEFKRIYEQEMYRLKPPPDLPKDIKPDDEDPAGGLAEGM